MRGFLPSTGRLVAFRAPAQTLVAGAPQPPGAPGLRVDTGVYEGGEISIHYDSMICKLIACGADRGAAIAALRDALNGFVIRGVSSNLDFQAALLGHARFAAGDFDTGFIAEEFPHGFDPGALAHGDRPFLLALAAACERRLLARSAGLTGQLPGHELSLGERFVVVESASDGRRAETPLEVHVGGPSTASPSPEGRVASRSRARSPRSPSTVSSTTCRFAPRSSAPGRRCASPTTAPASRSGS